MLLEGPRPTELIITLHCVSIEGAHIEVVGLQFEHALMPLDLPQLELSYVNT